MNTRLSLAEMDALHRLEQLLIIIKKSRDQLQDSTDTKVTDVSGAVLARELQIWKDGKTLREDLKTIHIMLHGESGAVKA